MIDPKQLGEWQALSDNATPGPWTLRPDHDDADHDHVESSQGSIAQVEILDGIEVSEGEDVPDAAFIAAARTAVPALIAEVLRLREMLLEEVGEDGE
jgi:hypothetical protein